MICKYWLCGDVKFVDDVTFVLVDLALCKPSLGIEFLSPLQSLQMPVPILKKGMYSALTVSLNERYNVLWGKWATIGLP